MFQLMLFIGSVTAFIIGGLVVLIGIGAISGCVAGLIIMFAGGIISLIGIWTAISMLMPSPRFIPAKAQTIDLIKNDNGRWA